MAAGVGARVQPPLDVLLVFRVLEERAGFGGQQGRVVTEGVHRGAVTLPGLRLTKLLCYL